jgi:hypothetical protein
LTTIVLYHPRRPLNCLLNTLGALEFATKKPHRVELVVQGPLQKGISLPRASEFKFELVVDHKEKNVGLSLPLHESIERLESPWWAKVDDDITIPKWGWDLLIRAIEAERKRGEFDVGAGFISPGDIPSRLFRKENGQLVFYNGTHATRKLSGFANYEICDYSGMGVTVIPVETFKRGICPDPRYFVSGENIDFAYQMWMAGVQYAHMMNPTCVHHKHICTNAEYNQDRWSSEMIWRSCQIFYNKWHLKNAPLWNACGHNLEEEVPEIDCVEGDETQSFKDNLKPVDSFGECVEGPRIIGIIGRSFCGSTLLSRLMAAIDGVGAAGELHWVHDAPLIGDVKTKAGWPVTRRCVKCGEKCRVFSESFIASPPKKKDLYREVAERMGVDTLVVSDKLTGHYSQCCARNNVDGIVLFKRPEAAALSDMRNEGQTVEQAVAGYAGMYDGMLRWAPQYCRRLLFVNYEELAEDPWGMTEKVRKALGIPGELPEEKDYAAVEYHAVGGNPKAHKREDISVDDRWKTELSARERGFIANSRANAIFKKLMQKRTR